MKTSNCSQLAEDEPEKDSEKEETEKKNQESSVQEIKESGVMRTVSHNADVKRKMKTAECPFN